MGSLGCVVGDGDDVLRWLEWEDVEMSVDCVGYRDVGRLVCRDLLDEIEKKGPRYSEYDQAK